MPVTQKNPISKNLKAVKTVVVTKTKEPVSKSAFSKKLKKVNDLLSKSVLLNS